LSVVAVIGSLFVRTPSVENTRDDPA
jgi:hypothetical protein